MSDQKTILIVEDEPDVSVFLKTLLEDEGFSTLTASNGREGFEQAKAQHPSLITLDITMPEESGMRMFRDLQEDKDLAGIPVVIITGVSPEFKGFIESRNQVRAPDAYFEKPVNRNDLINKVKELIAN
ncbi:response regulator [bacterium]|nr:response regulator [bacterium]